MSEHGELLPALRRAIGKMSNVAAGRVAEVEAKSGARYKYSYADIGDLLSEVRPILDEHGLAVGHDIEQPDDHHVTATTVITHDSGEELRRAPVTLPHASTAQAFGSALTYARRYSLTAALGLATDDDDGATAGAAPQHTATEAAANHRAENAAAQERGWMTFAEQVATFAGLVDDTNELDAEDVREWVRSEHVTRSGLTRNQAGTWAVKLAEHRSGDAAAAAPADEAGEGMVPADPSPAADDVPADENGDPL